jgi:ribosomal protein S18 acetylase RimI-like enzyme
MASDLERDFSIEEASSLADFLFLRILRNDVRHLMTNDTSYIGHLRQLKFYLTAKRSFKQTQSPRIYIARLKSRPVGYLLMRSTETAVQITEAVDCRFRRRGIGKRLVQFAQRNHHNLVAGIRKDNHGSIALHESMGFAREGENGDVLLYRYRRP